MNSQFLNPVATQLDASNAVIASLLGAHPSAGTSFAVHDPATGRVIASVPDMSPDECADLIDVSVDAGKRWARRSARDRSDILRRAYDLLMERREEVALVITREMGKPLTEARAEVDYGAEFVRWFSEQAVQPAGSYYATPNGDGKILVGHAPVGVCLLITPWNFPLAMATRKIAPALAAGCSAILKPAALTPLTSMLFVAILREAGVPEGVIQVATTTNASAMSTRIMADPRVRKISFTGSTVVGAKLLEQAGRAVMRTSMELGGNAPFIVLDDADLDRAVEEAMRAKLRNGGQSCTAANRILVQRGIADAFVEAFSERMAAVTIGNGLANPELGPVITKAAQHSMQAVVDEAVAAGAETRVGGQALKSDGYFFEATVLDHVAADATVTRDEVFGPVALITRFESDEDAISLANDTQYGLSAYLMGQDIDRMFSIADRLETGMVGFNRGVVSNVAAPFGGIKLSGLGREGGGTGLAEYQDIRYYGIAHKVA